MTRLIWVALVIVVSACAGATEDAATVATEPAEVVVTTTVPTVTTTTVPPTTTTTLNAEEAREAAFDLVSLVVGELAIADAMTSDENFVKFQQTTDVLIELIEGVRTGSVGWGKCDDAASAIEDAVTFWQEGVRLAKEGIETSTVDLIEDGTTLLGLGTDKLNEGRVLRDLCLG